MFFSKNRRIFPKSNRTQILVGDNRLMGALRHAMNTVVAFTLDICNVTVKGHKSKLGVRTHNGDMYGLRKWGIIRFQD